jgi:hypothetical protein
MNWDGGPARFRRVATSTARLAVKKNSLCAVAPREGRNAKQIGREGAVHRHDGKSCSAETRRFASKRLEIGFILPISDMGETLLPFLSHSTKRPRHRAVRRLPSVCSQMLSAYPWWLYICTVSYSVHCNPIDPFCRPLPPIITSTSASLPHPNPRKY